MGTVTERTSKPAEAAAPGQPAAARLLQRKCACGGSPGLSGECEECKKKRLSLQRKESGTAPSSAPPIVHETLNAPGRPLDPKTRSFMESRLGHDFSQVRVHTDGRAAESARAVNALAYTVGRDVVFGEGRYSPETAAGRRLLAHELVHVRQQAGAPPALDRALAVGELDSPAEREADAIAESIESASTAPEISEDAAPALRRKPNPDDDGDPSAPDAGEKALSRPEEVQLSKTSPGLATISDNPAVLSIFNFAIDSAKLKDFHLEILKEVGDMLRLVPSGMFNVIFIGHTDASGPDEHNRPLSRWRAEAAHKLVAKLAGRTFDLLWKGESEPVTENETVEGRSRNRRVDILFKPARPIVRRDDQKDDDDKDDDDKDDDKKDDDKKDDDDKDDDDKKKKKDDDDDDDDDWFCFRHPLICILLPLIPFVIWWCLKNPLSCLPIDIDIDLDDDDDKDKDKDKDKDPDEDDQSQVSFSTVNAANTPGGMKNRIPPRVGTPVSITVTNPAAAKKQPIQVTVIGGSAANGTALLDGKDSIEVTDSRTSTLVGQLQSEAGGTLRLVATQGTAAVGTSNSFAVASIPENVTSTFDKKKTGPSEFGVSVVTSWNSDSGQVADLDKVTVEEQVAIVVDLGSFASLRPVVQTTIVKGNKLAQDDHTIVLKRPLQMSDTGQEIADQAHAFLDERTGSPQLAIARSGFLITKEIKENPSRPGCLVLAVEKEGRDQDVNGFKTDAGTTVPSPIEGTVELPCSGGPGGGGRPKPPKPPKPGGGTPPTPTPKPGPTPSPGPGPIIATPRPFKGKAGGPKTRFLYVSGRPDVMANKEVFDVTIVFLATPLKPHAGPPPDPRFGGKVMAVAIVEFEVTDASAEPVVITSTNKEPLDVAPEDHAPLVLSPGTVLHVPKGTFKPSPKRTITI